MPALYNRPGGGPAPLFPNPSIAICVVLFSLNVVLFVVSTCGAFTVALIRQSCDEPLLIFMVVVGLESIISSAYFVRLASVKIASDTEWIWWVAGAAGISMMHVITVILMMLMLMRAINLTDCTEGATTALHLTFACGMLFILNSTVAFFAVYFDFFSSFALEMRRLKDFT